MAPMLIIALADLHGDVAALRALGAELARADVVLLAGDVTHFGRRPQAAELVEEARRYARRLLAVPGNCDYAEVGAYLADEGVSLDARCAVIEGVGLLGVGGSLLCPGRTPNELSEEEFTTQLEAAAAGLEPDVPTVLLAHEPPYGAVVDRAGMGRHVGSHAVRAFIERRRPLVCFSGHIHEARGDDMIQGTVVLNPGPARHGGFAYAEVDAASRAVRRAGVAYREERC